MKRCPVPDATAGPILGRVAELWRYPVKSMAGERLERVRCHERGFDGDRGWAVRTGDGKLGSGKTTRRFTRLSGLLDLLATTAADGTVHIAGPARERLPVESPAAADLVSGIVGQPVELVAEAPGGVPHFDAAPAHIVTTSSLRWITGRHPAGDIDSRRFRPNLVVATDQGGRVEEGWIGHTLRIGEVQMTVHGDTERCVMVTMAQPGLPFRPAILKDLSERAGSCFGVYATVDRPGVIRVGDAVELVGAGPRGRR